MNKHLYRIIFNERRGQLMVVADNAVAVGKATSGEGGTASGLPASTPLDVPLRRNCVSLYAAFGMLVCLAVPVHAQIVADPNAPGNQRATVLQTSNGVVQVNIQTPSAAGVSRNVYSQFDVTAQGAVLNNSRTDVQSQIGGWVQGNPWLAAGGARVILNEVNSINPSKLNGYVEVAGQRAELVIANPSGVSVDGGGFINASRVTVTTGTPIINGGSLDGYLVERGTVTISGQGMDASQADYAAIMARAVQVNAGIWAKELHVITGAYQVDAHASPAAVAGAGAAPSYALDVAHLGGMYAGKITLIGTEAGLGVRNAGTLAASSGNLLLDANGWLSNSGSLQGANAIISTAGDILNAGTVYAGGDTSITSGGDISGDGMIAAHKNTTVQATGTTSRIDAGVGAVIASGMSTDGSLGAEGDLRVRATTTAVLHGTGAAAGNIDAKAGQLDLSGARVFGEQIVLTASDGNLDASQANISTQDMLTLGATQTVRTDAALVTAGQLSIGAHNLSNVGGQILQSGAGDLSMVLPGTLDNSQGQIASNSDNLTFNASTLRNTGGIIAHAGSGTLGITATTLSGQRGQINSNGTLTIAATDVDHRDASAAAQRIAITTSSLDNSGGAISQTGTGQARLLVAHGLDNSAGRIESSGDASIDAGTVQNSAGRITAAGAGTVTTGILENAGGVIAGGTTLAVASVSVDNTYGSLQALGGDAMLRVAELNNADGSVYARGNLNTIAGAIENSGSIYAAGDLNLGVSGALTNTGVIAAQGDTFIGANSLASAAGSLLGAGVKADGAMALSGNLKLTTTEGLTAHGQNLAGRTASLTGASVDVSGSQTSAADITINANGGSITTSDAVVSTAGTLKVTASQELINARGILSASQLVAQAAGLDNKQGTIIQTGAGNTAITVDGNLDNTAGRIMVNSSNLTLGADTLLNTDGTIEHAGPGALAITAATLSDARGTITSNGSLNVDAGAINHDGASTSAQAIALTASSLSNRAGHMVQSGAGGLILSVTGRLDNSAGEITGAGDITVQAGAIGNDHGRITSANSSGVTSKGDLNNSEGVIAATHALTASAGALDNTRGTIQSGDGALHVDTASLINSQGMLSSGTSLTTSSAGDMHNDGLLYSGGDQTLNVGGTFTNSGSVAAQGAMTLSAGSILSGVGSLLGAGINIDGSLAHTGNLTVSAVNGLRANGDILAGGNAVLSGALINLDGSQTGADNIAITATSGGVSTGQAQIGTVGTLSVRASETLDNRQGSLTAGQLALDVESLNNDHGVIIQSGAADAGITLNGTLDNTSGHIAVNSGNLTLGAGTLRNTDGKIEHAGSGTLAINAAILSGQRGQITGNGSLNIAAGDIDHRGAATTAQRITIAATNLDNSGGQIAQLGDGTARITTSANLQNSGGAINSNGDAAVAAGTLDNSAGRIAAVNNAGVTASHALNNSAGAVIAGANLTVLGGDVDNASGSLQALAGNATLTIANMNNAAGAIYAAGNLHTTASNVTNTGSLYATGDQTLAASGVINNSGTIAAHGNTVISANALTSGADSLLAAGVRADGTMALAGNLRVSTAQGLAATGQNLAAGSATLTGNAVDISGSQTSASNIALSATGGNVSTGGAVVATTGTLAVAASQSLENRGGTLSAGQLVAQVTGLDNTQGMIVQTGVGDTAIAMSGTLDNTSGRIAVNSANLTLGSGTLLNTDGVIEHAGAGSLAITAATLNGTGGSIIGNGGVNITADVFNHDGATTFGQDVTVRASTLDNRGGQLLQSGAGSMTLDVASRLDNAKGEIAANDVLTLQAGAIDNSDGSIGSVGSVMVASQSALNNTDGVINAAHILSVSGQAIDNTRGAIQAGDGALTLNAASVLNNQGTLSAGTDLTASTIGDLHNDGVLYAGRDQSLSVGGTFTNITSAAAQRHMTITAGSVQSGVGSLLGAGIHTDGSLAQTGNLTVSAMDALEALGTNLAVGNLVLSGRSVNLGGSETGADNIAITATHGNVDTGLAQIGTPGTLSISAAQTLDNHLGNLSARQLELSAANLNNDHGTVIQSAAGDTSITMTETLDNTSGRIAVNSNNLALSAHALINTDGAIEHAGTGALAINAGTLSGQRGEITGNGSLSITAGNIDHRDAATAAQRVTILAASLDNRDGQIVQLGSGSGSVAVSGSLDNRAGAIDSYGDSTITAASLTNRGGRIGAVGHVGVGVGILVDNTGGFIAAGTNLDVSGGNVDNTGGSLEAHAGDATLNIANLNNADGSVYASGSLNTTAVDVNNTGTMYAAGSQSLSASGALVNGGTIAAQGNTTLSANSVTSGTGSLLAAGMKADGAVAQSGNLNVTSVHDLAAHGQTLAAGSANLSGSSVNVTASQTSAANVTLNANAGDVITADALIATAGMLAVSASQSLVNTGGTLSAGQLVAQVASLDNTHGTIIQTGAGDTAIAMSGTLNNTAGRIAVNSANLTLGAGTLVNTDGSIEHAGAGTLDVRTTALNDARGRITANGSLRIAADSIEHSDASTIAQLITISAMNMDNRQGEITQLGYGATSIDVSGTLDNRAGIIASNGVTTVVTGNLDNQGGIVRAGGTAELNVAATATLDNRYGEIAGGGNTTLSGNEILNQLGRVSASGTLTATAAQGILNLQGMLAANGNVTLASATLDNTGGQLASVLGKVSVTTSGATNNDSGVIQAAGDVLLQNGGLSNTQAATYAAAGAIIGNNVTIKGSGQAIDNHLGTIAATLILDVDKAALNNDAGLLQGGTAINLGLSELTNTNAAGYAALHPDSHGGIVSGGTISMSVGSWNNAGGLFSASGSIVANTGYINNTGGGQVVGGSDVYLASTGLDNRNGQIQALGNLVLNESAHVIDNRQGLIRFGGDLTANAGEIDNRDTSGIGQGIEGRNITLNTPVLMNAGGAIRADDDVSIVSSSSVDNSLGLISAGNYLGIHDSITTGVLAITNTGGTVIGGQQTSISAGSISSDGRLLSLGDLTLELSGDYRHTGGGEITANGDATFRFGGDFYNAGQLRAGGTLAVMARNIENAAGGDVNGFVTRLSATDTLTNRGVIDGAYTELNAVTLDNLGTGRIYGDHVSIAASLLNNEAESGVGATIAARERLDIGAQTIYNREHALILSGGDIEIGGALDADRLAIGRADVLNNHSATIEALGNLRLAATDFNNRNDHFTEEYIPGAPIPIEEWTCQVGTGYECDHEGNTAGDYYSGTYEVSSSDPSRIAAGGALSFDATNILNDNSKILAGGMLSIGAAELNNSGPQAERAGNLANGAITEQGNVPGVVPTGSVNGATGNIHSVGAATTLAAIVSLAAAVDGVDAADGQQAGNVVVSGDMSGSNRIAGVGQNGAAGAVSNAGAATNDGVSGAGSSGAIGLQSAATHVDSREAEAAAGVSTEHGLLSTGIAAAAIGAVEGSQAGAAMGNAGPDRAGLSVQTGVDLGGKAGATARSATAASVPPVARVGDIEQVVLTTPTGGAQIVRTSAPNTGIPNASLYIVNPAGSASYLIETDPRFANYRQWHGSDYMLDQLELDSAVTQKRLGDGYYEQSLVRAQVAQLTGRRFLGDFTSDDDEYCALMDAGIAYAKTWNLRPGVALSAAQMAVLSSDIVWLVETEVTLADGSAQKVLVPRVYARVRDGDIDGSGGLLSGRDVDIQVSGNLVNTGTIAGRDVVRVTADNVNNLGGRVNGDGVIVAAKTDLNNIGGTISANSALVATAGRDINIETTTRSVSSMPGTTFGSGIVTDKVAGLYVTGDGPSGSSTLVASAGRDIKLLAGQIGNAGTDGATVINAGRNIELGTVTHSTSNNMVRDANNFRKEGTTTEVGSQIVAAGSVALKADNDINLRAASVEAGGALTAQAGNNINIVAGLATSMLDVSSQTKKRGFLKSKTTTTRNTTESTNSVGSILVGNTVNMTAGKDITVTGSTVLGEGAVKLSAGNNLTIESALDTYKEANSVEVKKKGLTGGFSAGVLSIGIGKSSSASQNSLDQVTQVGSIVASTSGNTRLQAGDQLSIIASDIGAGKDLTLIGKDVSLTAAQDSSVEKSARQSKSSGLSIGITVNPVAAFKSAKQQSEKGNQTTSVVGKTLKHAEGIGEGLMAATTAVVVQAGSRSSAATQDHEANGARVSTLQAGGDLTINATGGSITSGGTSMSAEGNALLIAKETIVLGVAHSLESQAQDSKAKGVSFDNRGPLMAGAFNQKANGTGSTESITGTTLSVGGNAALATTTGDIKLTGSSVVATGDTTIKAARDLTIESSQNSLANDNHSSNQAIGKVVISDTERFAGYSKVKHNDSNAETTQVESNVSSLNGNVTLAAGEKFTQTASNILAGQDISITAKTIDIGAAANTGNSTQDNSDLKIGAFARISSPLIDLANNIEAAKNADGRVKSMQNLAAGANAYQTASGAAGKSGFIVKGEVGVGFSSAKSQDQSSVNQAIGSTIKGGGNVSLTSTEGDINATGANIVAGRTLALDSAKDIVLEAAQSNGSGAGKNSSAGVEVGVGYSIGAQTGVYYYAAANVGKGDYKNEATTNSNTRLSGDMVTLGALGDTTLKGADVKANTIAADVKGKLAVESMQDTVTQHNQQSNAGVRVQIALGTAWEVSGNASHSEANGSSIAVAEQSGLFAGAGGYHVKADSIALKGGAIASTSVANSDLTTNAIMFEHVKNQMDFKAQGVSVSGAFTTGSIMESNKATPAASQGVAEAPAQTSTGARNPNITPGLPTQDKGNDSSTTYATLTDGKLNIGGQAMESAASLGAHTDASSASKAIAALPDLKVVMAEQKALSAASGTVIAASNQIAGDMAKAARDEGAKATAAIKNADEDIASARAVLGDGNSSEEQRAQAAQGLNSATQRRADAEQAGLAAQKTALDWSETGDKARALKAATDVLVGAVGGQAGGVIAANAGAPYLYKAIGDLAQEKTKPYTDAELRKSAAQGALDTLNAQGSGEVDPAQRALLEQVIAGADATMVEHKEQYNNWKEGSANKMTLHALATAALNTLAGSNALDGAIAGGLNEAKAPILEDLTKGMDAAGQKFVAELTSLGVGAALGNAQTASLTLDAERNNRQLHIDETKWIKNNAKKFADERKISVEEATKRLAQQASKDVDLVWRGTLPDTEDQEAKNFLARAKGETFTNSFGLKQELFSTQDGQFTAAQIGQFDVDRAFVKRYVSPDAKRGALEGVQTEIGQIAREGYETVKSDPVGVGKQVGVALVKGVWDAVTHPVSTANDLIDSAASSAKTFGEGVAVSTNEEAQRQLNSLYGQDVTTAVQIATSAQGAIMLGSALGAGKVAGNAAKGVGDVVSALRKPKPIFVKTIGEAGPAANATVDGLTSDAGPSAAEIASQRRGYLNDKFNRSGDVNLDITIRGRQEVAEKAFVGQGINATDIPSYMAGIDFSQPVWLEQLSPSKHLFQYQTPGAPQGNFYAFSNTVQPTELGISPVGLNRATNTIELKVAKEYATVGPATVLRSTAAAVYDTWSVAGQSYWTDGKAKQVFSAKKSSFAPTAPSVAPTVQSVAPTLP